MAVSALNAASWTLLVLSMLKVSTWSGAVTARCTRGGAAKPKLNGLAGAVGVMQQVNQVWPSFIARLPEANSPPAPEQVLATWAAVGMK